MIELQGDLWSESSPGYRPDDPTPWIVVPTNGENKANRHAVMGAGVAKRAAELFPLLPKLLGQRLDQEGNHVHDLGLHRIPIAADKTGSGFNVEGLLRRVVSFPTKRQWRNMSDPDLIDQSAGELVELVKSYGVNQPTVVLLPRVGTGLGGLGWTVVKPILEKHLKEDRYVVVTQERS